MKIYLKYLIVLVAGFLIGIAITCDEQVQSKDVKETTIVTKSTDTIVKWETKIIRDSARTNNLNVTYQNLKEVWSNPEQLNFDKSKYAFEHRETIYSDDEYVRTDLSITGWGGIDEVKFNFKLSDSTKFTTINNSVETVSDKTITKTIIKTPNAIFLSGEYIIHPVPSLSNARLNLDYTIKNKVIVGVSVGYDKEPNVGVRAGISL